MLAKPGELFDTLRRQVSYAIVSKREFSGVGFFTGFTLPSDAQVKCDVPDMTVGDVGAKLPGLEYGAGFVLFIRRGVINILEGYTYDEKWPESTDGFRVFSTASA